MDNLCQELVDLIIDRVAPELVEDSDDDPYTDWRDIGYEGTPGEEFAPVATCGLVCKRWLPRTRFHLFSTTRLSNGIESGTDNMDSFLDLVKASPGPLSFMEFLDLDFWGGNYKDDGLRTLFNLTKLTSLRLRTGHEYD
ncbi:hypothetical protein K438DRAFT_1964474 [Mycena galopus ATCC 62051]|nr:hypothetical protein K438DRAFT_1964474 [Mycena galopus ATCC 62051]